MRLKFRGAKRLGFAAASLAGLVAAPTLLTGPVSPAAAQGTTCPNAAIRAAQHTTDLPDCRAYEQVTPVFKGEQDAPQVNKSGAIYDPAVAASGDRAAYFSQGAFAGSPSPNTHYVATRGASDWSSQAVLPRQSVITGVVCIQGAVAYAEDLSRTVLVDGGGQGFFGCGADDPPIVPGEPEGVANLFVRDSDTGAYQLVSLNPVAGDPRDANFQGGSPDLSHVVFTERAQLTADATSGTMLYAWSNGAVRLVGQIPSAPATSCSGSSCTALSGADLGSPPGQGTVRLRARAVSADGSRIFFRARPVGGVESLYLREGETTTQIDVAQGGPGASGGGRFMTATAGGSSVFFTADSKLTADSTTTAGHPDLYRYDVGSGALTDLTVDTVDADGADVQGVVGASEDGSYLYFVANGVLAGNANSQGDTASPGDCGEAGGPTPSGEDCNLYLRHGDTTTFIATLAGSDLTDWGVNTASGRVGTAWTSRVTPDGLHVAFNSTRPLTGYDNAPADPAACVNSFEAPAPCNEVFIYDADSGQLQCASCNPSGAPPVGASRMAGTKGHAVFWGSPGTSNFSLPRDLSDDGSRVFFESDDALVPGDTNASQDVYAWEDGQLHLLSSGRHVGDSSFFDASVDGDSAFFITREQLVAQDTDILLDLYAARIGGGLAAQNQPPPAPPCSGDGCRGGASDPPAPSAPGSSAFTGPGNAEASEDELGASRRCTKLERKARKAKRKAKRAKHAFKQARRKARRADGKRAKRLERRAERKQDRLKKKRRQARRAKRGLRRCERGAQ